MKNIYLGLLGAICRNLTVNYRRKARLMAILLAGLCSSLPSFAQISGNITTPVTVPSVSFPSPATIAANTTITTATQTALTVGILSGSEGTVTMSVGPLTLRSTGTGTVQPVLVVTTEGSSFVANGPVTVTTTGNLGASSVVQVQNGANLELLNGGTISCAGNAVLIGGGSFAVGATATFNNVNITSAGNTSGAPPLGDALTGTRPGTVVDYNGGTITLNNGRYGVYADTERIVFWRGAVSAARES